MLWEVGSGGSRVVGGNCDREDDTHCSRESRTSSWPAKPPFTGQGGWMELSGAGGVLLAKAKGDGVSSSQALATSRVTL